MSDENIDPELQRWIEPELEARVVAWVLGEASEFEAAELARIVAEKPELEIFKRRIEAVHGLVAAAGRQEGMRMEGGRREKLVERLGGKKERGGVVVAMPQEGGKGWGIWHVARHVAGWAAVVALLALLASSMLPSFYGMQKRGAASKRLIEERQAEIAKEEDLDAQTVAPQSRATNAPVNIAQQKERLAALDGLKAMAGYQWDDQAEKKLENSGLAASNGQGSAASLSGGEMQAQVDRKAGRARVIDSSSDLMGTNTYSGAMTVAAGNMVAATSAAGAIGQSTDSAAAPVDTYAAAPASPPETAAPATVEMPASSAVGVQLERQPALKDELRSQPEGGVSKEASVQGDLALNDQAKFAFKKFPFGITRVGPVSGQGDAAQTADRPQESSVTQGEAKASDQPYSTFSLHVSDVSFLLAEAALGRGEMPDPGTIRAEEFYNAFDYGDPAPGTGEKIACKIEQAAHPLLQQRNLVRIAMKVAATGRDAGQPLRLTVLLDTSGSMEREDRAASVARAMQVLTSLLGPKDAVTLIGFAREPRLLAEEVPGNQAGMLVDVVKHIPAEGGTNMEEALKVGSELALRHLEQGGQNRVVMLTDGATNLGDADPARLAEIVERLRQRGVSFDACGVGADGLNDGILEALTRKGGGRYYLLNGPEDADGGFARQLAGAFRPAAENVKMQVRFNPERVGRYRLIGFEKSRLKQEDFRNDKVTAAQLAAEEAAVALYQVEVLPEGEGELGEVFVRFRDPADGRMVEQSWTIPYDARAPALDKAPASMQLAATAALLAEKLRGGVAGDGIDLDALEPVVARLRGAYAQQGRVGELVSMFEEARRMTARK